MRNLIKALLRSIASILFRVRINGSLPEGKSRLLIVANHESFLDGLLLGRRAGGGRSSGISSAGTL